MKKDQVCFSVWHFQVNKIFVSVIVKSNKETRPLSLFQKVGFFFALIGLILLITFVIILAPILQDKTELNANLSTMYVLSTYYNF